MTCRTARSNLGTISARDVRVDTLTGRKWDDGLQTPTKQRLVWLSPFFALNTYVESVARRIPGIELDIIERAELKEDPYIDAEVRERGKPNPSVIVDINAVVGEGRLVPVNSYFNWNFGMNGSNPTRNIARYFRSAQLFDYLKGIEGAKGKFNPCMDIVTPIKAGLDADLNRVLRGMFEGLTYFQAYEYQPN